MLRVNSLEKIEERKTYSCSVAPAPPERQTGLVNGVFISGFNYDMTWKNRPAAYDKELVAKIMGECVDAGDEFFREHLHAPALIKANSDGAIREGGTGLVYVCVYENSDVGLVKEPSKIASGEGKYSCTMFQSRNGNYPLFGTKFDCRWDLEPNTEFGDEIIRRLLYATRQQSRGSGRAPLSMIASYFPEIRSIGVKVDDGDMKYYRCS